MGKITIYKEQKLQTYEIQEVDTVLQALEEVEQIDPTLEYESGCKSGVCGCCSVRVDGRASLACQKRYEDGMEIAPLDASKEVQDLRVEKGFDKLEGIHLSSYSDAKVVASDVAKISLQTDCILCSCCYSACPVLQTNPAFLGPYALTKVLRYVDDIKENDKQGFIDRVQKDGVWDCTLCGECTLVCPQGIDSKVDIMQLRNKSIQSGYSDPNFQTMDFNLPFN